jgi:RNA polymerase-binding transcription factor DksA
MHEDRAHAPPSQGAPAAGATPDVGGRRPRPSRSRRRGSEDPADGADRRTLEETDEAVARQLTGRLEALQRAEDRLAAGTYGRPVLSGRPI